MWVALALLLCLLAQGAGAAPLDRDALAAHVEPPFELGERLDGKGVWSIRDRSGLDAGYIFETEPLAALPGFSGAPVNVLVTLDREGRFLGAELLDHNEPVFVSGLGEAPFHAFMRQYRGLSVFDTITVGVPYGAGDRGGSGQVYLDGVTKATASVRIAHESILAASLAVARERMQGLAAGPAPRPKRGEGPRLDWPALVAEGLARRFTITNAQVQAAFAGTLWEADDAQALARPDGAYLDLWIVDAGPDALARAVLDAETMEARDALMSVADHDEPLLLLANGRHGLVSEDFVRNTAPDLLLAEQGGLPVALRDADLEIGLAAGVPDFEHRMMLRTDRRLGFDPTREWTLIVRAVRRHGAFRPEIGIREFRSAQSTPARFFDRPETRAPQPVWLESLLDRRADLLVLGAFLVLLGGGLAVRQGWIARPARLGAIRAASLAFTLVFIGWWGQGQLSIVTVIGTLRAAADRLSDAGGSFAFLLYDPFSLAVWGAAIAGFVLWGRGLFCGWLCPYGAMQEFADRAGRLLGVRRRRVPERLDTRLKGLKYAVLFALVATGFAAPALNDALVEIEPFKTAITVGFRREWYFVLYALGWLALGLVWFKPFCRYVCPLGAVMALGGLMRARDWIPRRPECGAPCQLCKVRCHYDAIRRDGRIIYGECFQCLDCVSIHDDPARCVPLVLRDKSGARP